MTKKLTYWQKQYRKNPFERDYLRFRSMRKHLTIRQLNDEHEKRRVIFNKFCIFVNRAVEERTRRIK